MAVSDPDFGRFKSLLEGENVDPAVEEMLEDARPVKGGITNSVYETEDGDIVKVYSDFSVTAVFDTIYRTLTGTGFYPSRKSRMRAVEHVRENADQLPMVFPEILQKGRRSIEFENVPGQDGTEYLEKSSGFQAYDLGFRLGQALGDLEDREIGMKIFSLDNLKVDGYDIYSFDHEFWSESSTARSRWMGKMLLMSSATRVPEKYDSFREGFEDAYGELESWESGVPGLMTAAADLAFSRNPGSAVQSFRNIYRN